MPDPVTPARSPLTDPRPGDRVVSGDGFVTADVGYREGRSVCGIRTDPQGRLLFMGDLDDWRDWCRRNDARPAAGEGEAT